MSRKTRFADMTQREKELHILRHALTSLPKGRNWYVGYEHSVTWDTLNALVTAGLMYKNPKRNRDGAWTFIVTEKGAESVGLELL